MSSCAEGSSYIYICKYIYGGDIDNFVRFLKSFISPLMIISGMCPHDRTKSFTCGNVVCSTDT